MMLRIGFAGLVLISSATGAMAWDQDFFGSYSQRSDTMTLGAGNAKTTNSVTHMINPWPPYVMDRRIPNDGERMTGAVQRYRESTPSKTPCPLVPQFDIQVTGVRSTSATQCGTANVIQGAAQNPQNTNTQVIVPVSPCQR